MNEKGERRCAVVNRALDKFRCKWTYLGGGRKSELGNQAEIGNERDPIQEVQCVEEVVVEMEDRFARSTAANSGERRRK